MRSAIASRGGQSTDDVGAPLSTITRPLLAADSAPCPPCDEWNAKSIVVMWRPPVAGAPLPSACGSTSSFQAPIPMPSPGARSVSRRRRAPAARQVGAHAVGEVYWSIRLVTSPTKARSSHFDAFGCEPTPLKHRRNQCRITETPPFRPVRKSVGAPRPPRERIGGGDESGGASLTPSHRPPASRHTSPSISMPDHRKELHSSPALASPRRCVHCAGNPWRASLGFCAPLSRTLGLSTCAQAPPPRKDFALAFPPSFAFGGDQPFSRDLLCSAGLASVARHA